MQKTSLIILSAAALSLLTSCSGKLGSLSADNFTVAPSPLESQAGSVTATVSGTFPEKYMNKKAVITVTPELRQADGSVIARGQGTTFQGEEVMGNDQTVNYRLGGHYTLRSQFDYQPSMQQSELYMTFDAKVGSKPVQVPAVKVADGVIATSELYHRTLDSARPSLAADAFQRVTAQKYDASIRFLIQQANLRRSELKTGSVQEFVRLLQQISRDPQGLNLTGIDVSAYASPDGGVALNERLASQRQDNTEAYVRQQMRQAGVASDVQTAYTAQDWEGFQKLVRASNIQDKDVILRVLSMYQDPEEREQQIKNMSQGFRELADGILPELRRARMTINYEVVGRSDEQILAQLRDDASQLSVEEMLYAATLQPTADARKQVYLQTAARYPQDYRALNNAAAIAYAQGDYAEASRYWQQARQLDARSPETAANLGLMALREGDVAAAENYIGQAGNANGLAEILGNLHLAQGNYALAEQDFAQVSSSSAALAQLLNRNYAKAAQTLATLHDADATTDYLSALVQARQGNTEAAAAALRSAIQKDPSLAAYAARDLELTNVSK